MFAEPMRFIANVEALARRSVTKENQFCVLPCVKRVAFAGLDLSESTGSVYGTAYATLTLAKSRAVITKSTKVVDERATKGAQVKDQANVALVASANLAMCESVESVSAEMNVSHVQKGQTKCIRLTDFGARSNASNISATNLKVDASARKTIAALMECASQKIIAGIVKNVPQARSTWTTNASPC